MKILCAMNLNLKAADQDQIVIDLRRKSIIHEYVSSFKTKLK